MKALVIDDQPEFMDSISLVLKRKGFRPSYVGSMDEGLNLIGRQTFDLAFVDLQMPPGNWGGLEIIRQLHILDGGLPIVVLSGKGSLAECIEAVRLGARDYIPKENFESDFRDRILPIYSVPYAISSYPSLLGYLYRVFKEERNSYLRTRKLMDVFEFTIRMLALCIVADLSEQSKKDRTQAIVELGLGRASLGTNVAFVFETWARSESGPFLEMVRQSELRDLKQSCFDLTNLRNENFGHTVTMTEHQASQLCNQIEPVITRILNSVSFLRRLEFLTIESLDYDGVDFEIRVKILRGDNLLPTSAAVKNQAPIPKGHMCIFFNNNFLLDLDPLLQIKTSPTSEHYSYVIYDKQLENRVQYLGVPRAY